MSSVQPLSPSLWLLKRHYHRALGPHGGLISICLLVTGKELHNPSTTAAIATLFLVPFLAAVYMSLGLSYQEQLAPKLVIT